MTYEEDLNAAYALRMAAYEAVAAGDAEIIGEEDGEPIFKLTDSGRFQAEAIIDAAIRTHGNLAAEKLSEALDVPLEVGEDLVALRQAA